MLLPINWLDYYVQVDDVDIKDLADRLTDSGSHIESIMDLDRGIENIVLAKIMEKEAHPDAEKLFVLRVFDGEENFQIVTGADNFEIGDLVALAIDGAKLPGDFEIKTTELRGVKSQGMLCSFEELGYDESVIPLESRNGIAILNSAENDLGTDIKEVLELHGYQLEIEVTPNRSDCQSIVGLARETAATLNRYLIMPEIQIEDEVENIKDYMDQVIIETEKCERYYVRVIKEVKIEPSPQWMQNRLMEAGMRPTNNIVDITNYVMLELGQPLHAFDISVIDDRNIFVRESLEDEKFITLDSEERILEEGSVMITDGRKPLAIGGIMGGLESGIYPDTHTVLLESANFKKSAIRKTSKALGLRSEASARFERGVTPRLAEIAAERACQLIEELGAGVIVEGVIDVYPNPKEDIKIQVTAEKVNRILGTELDIEEMKSFLDRLEIKTEIEEDTLICEVPSFRPDLTIEEDIVEEIGRLFGFNNIKAQPLRSEITRGTKPKWKIIETKVKNNLSALGLNEMLTYSFISPKAYDSLNLPEDHDFRNSIEIINPLGEDYSIMRKTLVSNLLDIISRNYNRGVEATGFYEIGNVFYSDKMPIDDLPNEFKRLVIGQYGEGDFYNLKEKINLTLDSLNIKNLKYERLIDNPILHPGRGAKIILDGKKLGFLGEVHPDILKNYDIGKRVYISELDFDLIVEKSGIIPQYKELPRYPKVTRDIAVIVDEDLMTSEIEDIIKSHGTYILEDVKLFDIYSGDQIEEGKKSMAYTMDYRAADRTLKEAEIEEIQKELIADLKVKLDAELRS